MFMVHTLLMGLALTSTTFKNNYPCYQCVICRPVLALIHFSDIFFVNKSHFDPCYSITLFSRHVCHVRVYDIWLIGSRECKLWLEVCLAPLFWAQSPARLCTHLLNYGSVWGSCRLSFTGVHYIHISCYIQHSYHVAVCIQHLYHVAVYNIYIMLLYTTLISGCCIQHLYHVTVYNIHIRYYTWPSCQSWVAVTVYFKSHN